MKFLVLLLLLVGTTRCDSPDKNLEGADPVDSYGDQQDPPKQGSANPGEITFTLKIMDVYPGEIDICGLSKSNVCKVEVLTVQEGGMGITNMPYKKQQLLVNFIDLKDLKKNKFIEATGKESLCSDASNTYFTIKSFKFLE